MSVMIGRYSGFPPELFEKGIVLNMSGGSLRLYLFLLRQSDRKSSRQFTVTDQEISQQTGASTRMFSHARNNLLSLGLIHCQRPIGGSYVYTICDPETGQPYPGDPKVRAPYTSKKKQHPPAQGTLHGPVAVLPIAPIEPAPQKPCPPDTSFDFGHNVNSATKVYFPIDGLDYPR
jgi:hypothetical protein